ncbi:hypothetical protein STEG23_025455, partial [Scotinomys teguina]
DSDAPLGCCTLVIPKSSSVKRPAEIRTAALMQKGLGFGIGRAWLWGLFCPHLLLEPVSLML